MDNIITFYLFLLSPHVDIWGDLIFLEKKVVRMGRKVKDLKCLQLFSLPLGLFLEFICAQWMSVCLTKKDFLRMFKGLYLSYGNL